VGETYFLRHIEQFRALTEVVVPERLVVPGRSGQLRLLSAGCASGEEAYSMAIVMREEAGLPDTSILGIDVNPAALEKARKGRYTPWSLRAVPPPIRRRWFTTEGRDVVLDPRLRTRVRFERHNLVVDDPVLWRPGSFDAVFCRNVMMYFAPEVMAQVVRRIARSLVPGGYLFLGSAETLRGVSTEFQLRESHGTFYYQRKPEDRRGPVAEWFDPLHSASDRAHKAMIPTQAPAAPAPAAAAAAAAEPAAPRLDLGSALELLNQERFTEALGAIDELSPAAGDNAEVLLLRAALLSHSGSFIAAEQTCHRLLGVDELSAGAHVLLAVCRESEVDLQRAIEHCRTAVALDPQFAMPHVQLGRLTRRIGDLDVARREYAESARLLPAETDRRILLFGGGFDREALISLCRTQGADTGANR
jgi:chemotaxis protein methyltransferase CheR